MKNIFLKLCFIFFLIQNGILAITIDYLTTSCNVTNIYISDGRRLESSTALEYSNGMSCYYSVYVDAGKQVYLVVGNFDLEHEVMNVCVDYVNIYDGSTTSSATLNPNPICAQNINSTYTSTGNSMTIQMVTDNAGTRRGFDFNFAAITTGTCNSDQFACTTGVCIQDTLKCNNFDECGDRSDEGSCESLSPPGLDIRSDAALIAGLSATFTIIAIIAVVVGFFCWRYNRWRVFMKRPLTAQEVVHSETTFTTSYPVTKYYYKEHFQNVYREPERPTYYGYQGEKLFNAEGELQTTRT